MPIRVAIYTRKSTEEGLDQEFNSLDAQREAALAYIANRRHLHWQVVPDAYNDGGYTGGNLERPALQRLLGDIRQGKIDCVVTYKLDRISRSLVDFAQLMTLFEHHGVAFVSITQEFDSSTPVGRLTLNILSSFSQFEREIISERTRDKMAASRKKGMFVGGFPPFGYDIDPQTHKLVVNTEEAAIVHDVFATFLEMRSVTKVMHTLNAKGYRTKTFTSRRGRIYEGNPWCRFYVRRVLTNPLYFGNIRYRGQFYTGQQEPIIDMTQWQQVQALLPTASDSPPKSSMTTRQVALLRGLLKCGVCACAMTPSSCRKPNKAYRYYVCSTAQRHGERTCPVRSIPAGELEAVVVQELRTLFRTPERLTTALRDQQADITVDTRLVYQAVVALQQLDRTWDSLYPAVQQRLTRLLIETVTVYSDRIDIRLRAEGLAELGQDPLFTQEVSRG
jgi:DNA invertase Pin-like site-specific DNA recombinase